MLIHTIFDVLAAVSALVMSLAVYRWRLSEQGDRITRAGPGYLIALIVGAALGGYGFGTLNLWASGLPGIGRSIVGAMAGAIAAIELYKWRTGLTGSTGIVFAPAFATSVMIGRIGCYLSGLEDQTHGIPTSLPWGHDFGDGIARHPVQLYESAAMAAFLIFALVSLYRRAPFFMASGFYLMVGWYAAQRFLWEFLKPYGAVFGQFNVFHLVCAGLIAYAVTMCALNTGNRDVPAAA